MMLMNSTNREFLIEEQLQGAPYIAKAGLQTIPTGYIVCAPGGAVGEVGQADLISPNDTELISAYCQTAEMYGFSTVYLEAGSGASTPISLQLIKTAKSAMNCTLIVGGGIRTPEQMIAAAKAAGLVDALKGDGPLTVFALTDDAFAKLPEGTIETLLKPENKEIFEERKVS